MNIVFTGYFTFRKDPQRNKQWKSNQYSIIKPIYESVKKVGLNMIIFHDNLNEEFCQKYTTDKITFKKYILKGLNITTRRWLCFLDNLNGYDKILCIDCSDAEIYKDPFPLINDRILIGSENGLIKDSLWMRDRFYKIYDRVYYPDKVILNCGILGGQRKELKRLLEAFKKEVEGTGKNIDMPVFNKLLYDDFEIMTGWPIHSIFKKNEGPESGCYIRHK